MGADQSLIQATKNLGPSKFRDDSGWLKALGAVGKYVAVKRKQFQEATDNFSGVIEDVDIDGLVQYKDEVNGLLKTMKNVPAFMPKYKKARNRYNEIMSNVEGTKTLLSSLADKKDKIGVNASNLSIYQDPAEVAINADVMAGKYTTKMSDEGPLMVFESSATMLISDYVAKNPILISDSKTNNDIINTVINTHGADAKRNNKTYAAETVKSEVSKSVDEMWINGNDKTTILFNTNYETKNGSTTFMDYLAKTDSNYVDSLAQISTPDTKGEFMDWSQYDIPSDAHIHEQANILKTGLWKHGSEETIKQLYKTFLQEEVIKHQYQVNKGKKINVNSGSDDDDDDGYFGWTYAPDPDNPGTEIQIDPTKASYVSNQLENDTKNFQGSSGYYVKRAGAFDDGKTKAEAQYLRYASYEDYIKDKEDGIISSTQKQWEETFGKKGPKWNANRWIPTSRLMEIEGATKIPKGR